MLVVSAVTDGDKVVVSKAAADNEEEEEEVEDSGLPDLQIVEEGEIERRTEEKRRHWRRSETKEKEEDIKNEVKRKGDSGGDYSNFDFQQPLKIEEKDRPTTPPQRGEFLSNNNDQQQQEQQQLPSPPPSPLEAEVLGRASPSSGEEEELLRLDEYEIEASARAELKWAQVLRRLEGEAAKRLGNRGKSKEVNSERGRKRTRPESVLKQHLKAPEFNLPHLPQRRELSGSFREKSKSIRDKSKQVRENFEFNMLLLLICGMKC